MPYIATNTIITALRTWLTTWKAQPQDEAPAFGDAVYSYDAPELERALNDLLRFEDPRLVLLVPGQERYMGSFEPDRPTVRTRVQELTAIIAIREYAPKRADAPAEFVAVTALKDAIFASLALEPTVGLAGVCLVPEGGGPLSIRDEDGEAYYRAWAARLTTFAGHQGYAMGTIS